MKNIKTYKYINNNYIRKFNIGKNATSTGYEGAKVVDNSQLSVTPSADLSSQAESLRSNNVAKGVSSALQLGSNIYSQVASAGSSVAANAAGSVGSALGSVGSQLALNLQQTGTQVLNNAANALTHAGISVPVSTTVGSVSGTAAASTAGEVGGNVAGGAASSAGSVLGTAVPIAAIAYGGYNLVDNILDYGNYVKTEDMMNASGRATEYANGVAYEKNTGFDSNAVDAITRAQNTGNTIGMAGAGAGIGSGIGTLIAPGLGTLIGGAVGLLGGLFGGLFGGSSRKRKVEEAKNRAYNRIYSSNEQNEANAATQGISNQFYETHGGTATAKNGKNAREPLGDANSVGMINTPSGSSYGPISGLMNDKEVHGNILTGQSSTPNPNVPMNMRTGKESIPVGSDNGEADFQKNDFILSNDKPAYILGTNDTFAKLGMENAEKDMQLSTMKKYIQSEINYRNNKASKKVQEYNNKKGQQYINQIDQYLQPIREQQQLLALAQQKQDELVEDYVNNEYYKCGKNAYRCGKNTYKCGKNIYRCGKNTYKDGLNPLFGAAASLPYLISESREANSATPYAQNSFVPNEYLKSALSILGNLRYDPSYELSQLDQVAAQNRYNINQAGNLSAGQRAALISNANNQLFLQRAAIKSDAYNKNAQYKQAYAHAMMQAGQNEATRKQQALAAQQEAYRQAVGAKQKWQAQARKNWYTVGLQALRDFNSWDYANRMIDMYDAKYVKNNTRYPKTNNTIQSKTNTVNNRIPYYDIEDQDK